MVEMRRVLAVFACLLGLCVVPGALAGTTPSPPPLPLPPAPARPSWAQQQIQTVVADGLMAPSVAAFRPDDPLTKGELADLLVELGGVRTTVADPARPVLVRELDAALVRSLGLRSVAAHVRASLAAAGLKPPARAGTEAVARLLGLRYNHPQADDPLEQGPNDPITRAETAYSVARVLQLRATGGAAGAVSGLASLELPKLDEWQTRILTRAIHFVGFPYIWGGTSEKRQAPFGVSVPGGFDCSGFAWRIYKLQAYPDAPQLSATLKGRTTYVMSGEVPASQRIARNAIQPGDVLFFGDRGPRSKPSQVGHMGLYLGNGWFVHSGSNGVALSQLEGWYASELAWARRPLAEAGLI
jgi:cell wall-associated NlpC family hydrolase